MSEANERVLVVPADVLGPYLDVFRDGALVVTQSNVAYADELFGDLLEKAFFMDRAAAETDPAFLQLIPYCALTRPGRVFAYQRTKQAGEARLRGNWSFGVGGHVNPVDAEAGEHPYSAALKRELKEEVGLDFTPPDDMPDFGVHDFAPMLGLIYDPSNEVGRVHLGVVHRVSVAEGDTLTFADPALADGKWWEGGLAPHPLESWSAILLASFGGKLFQ